jgi:DNA (cytosine-5)-methyltransferase 1
MNQTLLFDKPELLTKQLAFKQMSNGKRKLVVSTNWLPLVGFESGDPNIEKSLGKGKGIIVERIRDNNEVKGRIKRVYSREYKQRRNNPIETLLDISSQKLLDESFPSDCINVHITFTQDKVVIVPLTRHQDKALRHAKAAKSKSDMLSVFAACTSGVDLHAMQSNGFSVHSIIEYRPQESRDKQDLTETGALNALANTQGIKAVYNEDINHIDVGMLAKKVSDSGSPFTNLSFSLQCDDYSNVKSKSLKERSQLDLSSTIDMTYDAMRIIEALYPPTVLFENVKGWIKSEAYDMLSLRLRRWGYKEHSIVADARDYGGLTSRERAYAFFSVLPSEFKWEEPIQRRDQPIWDLIKPFLADCRDVTHSKSLQKGMETGRLRMITPNSCHSPTLLKSQLRMAKDSVVIVDENRLYWPTEALMKFLMGIDDNFNVNSSSQTIASEIIGQSVDMKLHDMIIRCVKRHITAFFNVNQPQRLELA